jgi:pilus assembly protein CpaF
MAKSKRQYEEMDYTSNKPKRTLATVIKAGDEDMIAGLNSELKSIIADSFGNQLKVTEILKGSDLEKSIYDRVVAYINDQNITFEPTSLKAELINAFVQSLSGYGAIQPLMDDDEIEEIYVYDPNRIYILKHGVKELSDVKFGSRDALKGFIDNILGRIGRNVNNKNPIEDGRLADGSRVAVSSGALSPQGDTINIRKFRREMRTLTDMVENRTMDQETKDLLIKIIQSEANFLVSGGTASGKTTLLNAMAQYIPANENVESIEDNIELQLHREF